MTTSHSNHLDIFLTVCILSSPGILFVLLEFSPPLTVANTIMFSPSSLSSKSANTPVDYIIF